MAEILKLFFLTTLIFNLSCKATLPANPDVDYKSMTVELDPTVTPRPGVVVVNQLSTTDVPEGFKKYALYDGDKSEYFYAETVTYKSVVVKTEPTAQCKYVYDVYSYWKDDLLLAFAFRYYYRGDSSYYYYYRKDGDTWSDVKPSDYGAESHGLLCQKNLGKLLDEIAAANPKPTAHPPKQEEKKSESVFANTKVIVGVVIGFVVVVLLVGLVLFLRK